MFTHKLFSQRALAVLAGLAILLSASSAHAEEGWVSLFQDQYPLSLTDNNATPNGCIVYRGQTKLTRRYLSKIILKKGVYLGLEDPFCGQKGDFKIIGAYFA
jgi:hypothetical protein